MNIPIVNLPEDFEGFPPAGLYRCPDATYRRIKAISASRLKLCRESMAAFKRNEPIEDTDSMRFGRALHCYANERDQFDGRYVVAPSIKLTSAEAKAEYAAWANDLLGDSVLSGSMSAPVLRESLVAAVQARGGDVVEADWIETIAAMREGIAKNPNAEHHLTGPGEAEVVMVWRDPETGYPCKAKADRIQTRKDGGVWINDLKSMADIGPRVPVAYPEDGKVQYRYPLIDRHCRDFLLYHQARWYEMGYQAVASAAGGDPACAMTFTAICKKKPGRCVWFTPASHHLASAGIEIDRWMRGIRECVRTGVWPEEPSDLYVVE